MSKPKSTQKPKVKPTPKKKTPLEALEPLVISEIIVPLLIQIVHHHDCQSIEEVFDDFRDATGSNYTDRELERFLAKHNTKVLTRVYIEGYNEPQPAQSLIQEPPLEQAPSRTGVPMVDEMLNAAQIDLDPGITEGGFQTLEDIPGFPQGPNPGMPGANIMTPAPESL